MIDKARRNHTLLNLLAAGSLVSLLTACPGPYGPYLAQVPASGSGTATNATGSQTGAGAQAGATAQTGVGAQAGVGAQVGVGAQAGVGAQVGAGAQVGVGAQAGATVPGAAGAQVGAGAQAGTTAQGSGNTTGQAASPVTPAATAVTPAVNAMFPPNSATTVATNASVTAAFNKAMDPATLTAATYTLTGPGNAAVPGAVSYDAASNTATFLPTSPLMATTGYTATVTTGAKDATGQALASSVSWSFTTAAMASGQNPVSLSSTLGKFAVLGGSTVTNSGLTTVTGDVGVSPGSQLVGFDVPGGPGSITGNRQVGTPTAAQAKNDLGSAYNDATSRSGSPVSQAGNIGGMTLAPGLYKSQTSLAISSGDLTLDAQGNPNAIWVFQMGSTLTTTPGRQVILAGGAKANNIFWQVGSSATLGTTTVFKGNILAAVSITMNTGSSLEGRALAQSGAVALNACTVTVPSP